jgi:hypothetical protein
MSEEGSGKATVHFLFCLLIAQGYQATKNGVMWKNNVAVTNALAKSIGNVHYSLIISK